MSSEDSNASGPANPDHWTLLDTLGRLPLPATAKWPHGVFDTEVCRRGDISLSMFAPRRTDFQTPHEQDEIYIVASGHGELHVGDRVHVAGQGDALFVAAGVPHRFENFSEDFATWVIFFPHAEAAS